MEKQISKKINGTQYIHIIKPDIKNSLISIWFSAGSRFDDKKTQGLAHLFEHLLFKRTKTHPNEIQRLQFLEKRGIILSAETNLESAIYWHIQEPKNLLFSARVLLRDIYETEFTQSAISEEIKTVIEEASENKSNPDSYYWQLNNSALWGDHPLGNNLFGTPESLKKINLSNIKSFYSERYLGTRPVIVCVSPKYIDLTELIKKSVPAIGISKEKSSEPITKVKKITKDKRKTDSVTVTVSYRTTSIKNNDEIRLTMLCEYLSNHWSSKLNEVLRIKNNITYWVRGESVNFSDNGLIRFTFNVEKSNVAKAIKLIKTEIESVGKGKIDKDALVATKNVLITNLVVDQGNLYELMWHYGWRAINNAPSISTSEYVKKIKNTSAVDVVKAAKKYCGEKNVCISTIGD